MTNSIESLPIDEAETLRQFGYSATEVGPGSHRKIIVCCTVCGKRAPRKRRDVTPDVKCRHCSSSDPTLVAKKKASIIRRFGETGLKSLPRKRVRLDPNRKVQIRCNGCNMDFLRHIKVVQRAGPGWRCSSCSQRASFSTRHEYACDGLPIDVEATLREFGYPPDALKPTSNRKVIIRCTVCTKLVPRARCFVTADVKCLHCRFSDPVMVEKKQRTLHANLGPDALQIVQQRRAETIRMRYDESPFVWTRQAESGAERAIKQLIEGALGAESVTKKILSCGLHVDVYVALKRVGFEYHGLYYHHELSPSPRGPDYHARKLREARAEKIRLVQIFEDEWRMRRVAVEEIILASLGIFGRRFGARQCEVRGLSKDEARVFMRDLHLQGASRRTVVAQGLFFQGELVGAASLARHHRQTGDLVLDRLCFARGTQVIGGASRLLKTLEKDAKELGAQRLVTWSDNRWSEGGVYQRMGFQREAELPPDYQYVRVANPKERLSKQSQKKSSVQCPEGLTEHEWALNRGLARIWDCGKVRWVRPLI